MDFNWSTFILEIINFIVLVWLLKHFFYKPVCDVLDKRRFKVDEQINSANAIQSDAIKMKNLYENRLTAWEEEKRQQQSTLSQALETLKREKLILLEESLSDERQKNSLLQEKQSQILVKKAQRQALEQGALFTAKLLQELSSQELENKLIERCLNNMTDFLNKKINDLSSIAYEEIPIILVTSAYPLSKTYKDNIERQVQGLFEHAIHCDYQENRALIAGLRVNIGAYVIRANLLDELSFFSDAANGD